MPSKSSRAASRQAQLRKRKQRGKARTQVFDAGPAESASQSVTADETAVADEATTETETPVTEPATAAEWVQPQPAPATARERSTPVAAQAQGRSNRAPAPVRGRSAQAPAESAMRYPYLGQELKRIGVFGALIVAILIVLTVFLG